MINSSINARVRSIPVGEEPEFEGTIVDKIEPSRGPTIYVIKRDDGTKWFREWRELFPPKVSS